MSGAEEERAGVGGELAAVGVDDRPEREGLARGGQTRENSVTPADAVVRHADLEALCPAGPEVGGVERARDGLALTRGDGGGDGEVQVPVDGVALPVEVATDQRAVRVARQQPVVVDILDARLQRELQRADRGRVVAVVQDVGDDDLHDRLGRRGRRRTFGAVAGPLDPDLGAVGGGRGRVCPERWGPGLVVLDDHLQRLRGLDVHRGDWGEVLERGEDGRGGLLSGGGEPLVVVGDVDQLADVAAAVVGHEQVEVGVDRVAVARRDLLAVHVLLEVGRGRADGRPVLVDVPRVAEDGRLHAVVAQRADHLLEASTGLRRARHADGVGGDLDADGAHDVVGGAGRALIDRDRERARVLVVGQVEGRDRLVRLVAGHHPAAAEGGGEGQDHEVLVHLLHSFFEVGLGHSPKLLPAWKKRLRQHFFQSSNNF